MLRTPSWKMARYVESWSAATADVSMKAIYARGGDDRAMPVYRRIGDIRRWLLYGRCDERE